MNMQLAQDLVKTLPIGAIGLFNPWVDRCVHDSEEHNGPEQRLVRLAEHLDCQPKLILVGEAPGYQGCRYSGVAFTSERLVMEGAIPRVEKPGGRLTRRHIPFSELSATIVWKQLHALGVHEKTILWNALQMHPHLEGLPWTNRTPTKTEFTMGQPAMHLLRCAFPQATVVAVGKNAERLLMDTGIVADAVVRHPANWGAKLFVEGLSQVIAVMAGTTEEAPHQ